MSTPGTHPHFNDRSAVRWYTSLAEGLVATKARKKKVLIEYGRAACGTCRTLVEGAIPQEAVKARLNESFVAVAIDCDQPDPEVQDLWALHMSSAHSLPFVFYTDADGQFLHGKTLRARGGPWS